MTTFTNVKLLFCLLLATIVIIPEVASARTVRKTARAKARVLSDVCTASKTKPLNGILVKITAGGHIGSGDARNSGYSIICGPNCASFPANVYHCDGSLAFRMGYYGRYAANGKPRGYCAAGGAPACSVSAIRSRSRALRCNGAGYLDLDGSRGKTCMRLNLNSNRNDGGI